MKQCTCFLLLIAFSSPIRAQIPYHLFGDSLAQWSQETGYCDSWTDAAGNCYMHGWINDSGGDTIINNFKYSKIGLQQSWSLFSDELSGYSSSSNYSVTYPGEIIGAVREDSLKRVWFRHLYNPQADLTLLPFEFSYYFPLDSDIILYNFNIQPGDTIKWKGEFQIVYTIDSIQLANSEFRRLFHFGNENYMANDYWIEGIGAANGFFGSYYPPPFEQYLKLDCYKVRDSLIYSNSFYNGIGECEIIYTAIEPVNSTPLPGISILPSFFSDHATVQLHSINTEHALTLLICNIQGQIIRSIFTDHKASIILSRDALPAGVYYLVAESGNHSFVSVNKFIIQ